MLVQEWPDLSVLLATNGLEGVTLAEKKKPGLILLDGMMPVMDGYTAARRLRQMPDTRSIPIIAITSDGRARARYPPASALYVMPGCKSLS